MAAVIRDEQLAERQQDRARLARLIRDRLAEPIGEGPERA